MVYALAIWVFRRCSRHVNNDDMADLAITNDITHGKDPPPILTTVEVLDSYFKSIKLAGKFSSEEILKGKMTSTPTAVPLQREASPPIPWPARSQAMSPCPLMALSWVLTDRCSRTAMV